MVGFDLISNKYSFLRKNESVKVFVQYPVLLDLISPSKGERILDLGCGDGALSIELAKKGALVTGFDSSLSQINLAKKYSVGVNGLEFIVSSHNAFNSIQTFDKAVISMVLLYLNPKSELRKFFSVAFKHLKKGGFLFLLDIDKDKLWFDEEHLLRSFSKNSDGSIKITFLQGSKNEFSTNCTAYPQKDFINLAKKSGFKLLSVSSLKIPLRSKSKLSSSFLQEFKEHPLWFVAVFQK